MASKNLNGSVQALAQALSDVVSEAVEPVRDDIKILRAEVLAIEKNLSERIDTTNGNIQAQLAQHRKDVSEDVRRIVEGE